jgi:hypothetical protein
MRLERTRRRPQAIHRVEGAWPADQQGTAMSAEGVALPSFAWDFCSVVGFLAQSSEVMDGVPRRPDLQRADPHRVDWASQPAAIPAFCPSPPSMRGFSQPVTPGVVDPFSICLDEVGIYWTGRPTNNGASIGSTSNACSASLVIAPIGNPSLPNGEACPSGTR